MIEFLKLCKDYENEFGVDITYLNRYLFTDEAIEFIKNRNGKKIGLLVNEDGQDLATPIYL
jgi:hypothetical protein